MGGGRALVYRIAKSITWEASHVLEGLPPDHQCGRLHGHSYSANITIVSSVLDEVGFVLDYGTITELTSKRLDHRHLNEIITDHNFKPVNPTAENIAKWIYAELTDYIFKADMADVMYVERVRVCETDTSYAEVEMVEL